MFPFEKKNIPWAVDFCSSPRVTMNLLVASLIIVLSSQLLSLPGQVCLARFVTVILFPFSDGGIEHY